MYSNYLANQQQLAMASNPQSYVMGGRNNRNSYSSNDYYDYDYYGGGSNSNNRQMAQQSRFLRNNNNNGAFNRRIGIGNRLKSAASDMLGSASSGYGCDNGISIGLLLKSPI